MSYQTSRINLSRLVRSIHEFSKPIEELAHVLVVEMVPPRVVEIVPVRVVEMVPLFVVEMVPVRVVEIVPDFAKAFGARNAAKIMALTIDLKFFIMVSW